MSRIDVPGYATVLLIPPGMARERIIGMHFVRPSVCLSVRTSICPFGSLSVTFVCEL